MTQNHTSVAIAVAEGVAQSVTGPLCGGGGSPPAGPTLAFHAATFNASTYEMEAQAVGTGTPTFAVDDGLLLPDWEGIYRTTDEDTAPQHGARRVRNLALDQDITAWNNSNMTVTSGISDPEGGTAAYRLQSTASNGFSFDALTTNKTVGDETTVSCWVRRVSGSGAVFMRTLADAGSEIDINSSLTSEWQRICSGVGVTATATTTRVGFKLITSGDIIEVCFMQAEIVSGQSNQNPGEYVPTSGTAASAYFANENGNTVSSNVVTEAVGTALTEAPSLYSAQAATNLRLHSNNALGSGWGTAGSGTVVAFDQNGVAGEPNTATLLTSSGSASDQVTRTDTIIAASGQVTSRTFVKKGAASSVFFEQSLSGGAALARVTFNTSDGSVSSSLGTYSITDEGEWWGVHLESTNDGTRTFQRIRIYPDTSGGTDSIVMGNTELYAGKTIAEIKGAAPIITAGSTVSVAATDHSFDSANWPLLTNYVLSHETMLKNNISNVGFFSSTLSTGAVNVLAQTLGRLTHNFTNTSDSNVQLGTVGTNAMDDSTFYAFAAAAHDGSGEVEVSTNTGNTSGSTTGFKNNRQDSVVSVRSSRLVANLQGVMLSRDIRIYTDFVDFAAAKAVADGITGA